MKFFNFVIVIVSIIFLWGCSFGEKPYVDTINKSFDYDKNSYSKSVSYKKGYEKRYKKDDRRYKSIPDKKIVSNIKRYDINSKYTGSIKGIIKSLRYDKLKKEWLYEIVGKDTSNFKLPYAKFYYEKRLADVGDYVYVILKNSSLIELYFIEKANMQKKKKNFIRKKRKKVIYKRVHKRDKSRKSDIDVPSEVHISFD